MVLSGQFLFLQCNKPNNLTRMFTDYPGKWVNIASGVQFSKVLGQMNVYFTKHSWITQLIVYNVNILTKKISTGKHFQAEM